MATYQVTIPIAGHAYVEVEADSEDAAIEQAISKVEFNDIESWEALQQFNQGNVCYCPSPWEAEAECLDEEEDEKES